MHIYKCKINKTTQALEENMVELIHNLHIRKVSKLKKNVKDKFDYTHIKIINFIHEKNATTKVK